MATMKQVAARAGVSTATVSYVLNGTGTVTDAVRRRVQAAIEALDYQPSYAARSLRTRSRTLGLVLPALPGRLADPLLAELLSGLSEAAAARGYYLLLATAGADQQEHLLCQQVARSGRVDGLVLLDITNDDQRVGALRAQQVPHVCAGALPEGCDSPHVAADAAAGAAIALRHLLGLDHRRIGLIALPSELADSEPRYQGYRQAIEAAGIMFDPLLVVEAGRTQEDGYTTMQELLGLPEPPTAVLASSDTLAFGAMHALRDTGHEAGRDVSLVGWDDAPLAAHTHPPLTTLHYERQTMGAHLARLLIGAIEGHGAVPHSVMLPMRLVVRKSTCLAITG